MAATEYGKLGGMEFESGKIIYPAGGATGYRPSLVLANFAPVSIDNDSSETTIFSFTIPGGMMGANSHVRIFAHFEWYNETGAGRTYTRRVKVGASTICDAASASFASTATRRFADLSMGFYNSGATNANRLSGFYDWTGGSITAGAGAPSATVTMKDSFASSADIAADTASDVVVAMTMQLSTNNAALEFHMRGGGAILIP